MMIKIVIYTWLAAILLAGESLAQGDLSAFEGTWVGTRSEVVDGQKIKVRQRTQFKWNPRLERLFGKTWVKIPRVGVLVARGSYDGDGRYATTSMFRGEVIAISEGTWTLVGENSMRATAEVQDFNLGRYNATAFQRLVGRNKLIAVSSSKNGRVRITLKRQSR